MEMEYSEEYKITVFLQKIEGIDESPFFSFFTTLETLPEETQTFDYVKDKFSRIACKMVATKKTTLNHVKSKDKKQKDSLASSSGKKSSSLSLLLSLSLGW